MGKKILIGITILLIAGLVTGWFLFARESKYLGTSSFIAIPENSQAIIRIHHFGNYTSRSLNNPVWKALSGFTAVSGLYRNLELADSLLNVNNKQNAVFASKDLTIVFEKKNLIFVESTVRAFF